MTANPRHWLPAPAQAVEARTVKRLEGLNASGVLSWLDDLAAQNRQIHEHDCVNLNPATNAMNPRAEAFLARGLGARPSLGWPGEKYEMGLEAIEQIEVVAAELACRVFDATFAEIRVPSGAIANLYAFMTAASPGDSVIVPPATVGGHVTHNRAGAAGLYGVEIHEAPIDPVGYTVDVDALAALAARVKPRVISIGGSLNLTHHPVSAVREIADVHSAMVLFDAAHLSGPIAGGAWPNPLDAGAHIMTMSTYKSLAGPPSGLAVTNDAAIAERLDQIAYPGLTANFDVSKSAALAVTLLDWIHHGGAHAAAMVDTAQALERALRQRSLPVHGTVETASHAFALDCGSSQWGGGGHEAALMLRRANLLTCAIGLPHDASAGLRLGANELVRWGAGPDDMDELASLIGRAFDNPEATATDVSTWRQRFTELQFMAG